MSLLSCCAMSLVKGYSGGGHVATNDLPVLSQEVSDNWQGESGNKLLV